MLISELRVGELVRVIDLTNFLPHGGNSATYTLGVVLGVTERKMIGAEDADATWKLVEVAGPWGYKCCMPQQIRSS